MRCRHVLSVYGLVGMVCILAVLCGCMRSQPSQHYTLAVLAVPAQTESATVIGIGPVRVPIHLRQPSLVARQDTYTLSFLDFHQWAQPLEDGIPRVIGENLHRLTGAKRVVSFPWPASAGVTHQLSLVVLAFELDQHGQAVFEARWVLRDGNGRMMDSGLVTLEKDVGNSPDEVASALSSLLLRFCEDITERIEP